MKSGAMKYFVFHVWKKIFLLNVENCRMKFDIKYSRACCVSVVKASARLQLTHLFSKIELGRDDVQGFNSSGNHYFVLFGPKSSSLQ